MKRIPIAAVTFVCMLVLAICGLTMSSGLFASSSEKESSVSENGRKDTARGTASSWSLSEGTSEYRGFAHACAAGGRSARRILWGYHYGQGAPSVSIPIWQTAALECRRTAWRDTGRA